MSESARETMDVDVVIVGAGPAGLAAACRLKQLAAQEQRELEVVVLEKGSEVGAHILSGAVLEPRALTELFPDWEKRGAPLKTPVHADRVLMFGSVTRATRLPLWMVPKPMHNRGNYIISLGLLCRWLAEQAEQLGVQIFPGFAAAEVLYHEDGSIQGVATGEMGRGADGTTKDTYTEGMELHAKVTLFAEGSRGQLSKQLIDRFDLATGTQHYGLGIKELWSIEPSRHQAGLVVHGAGWPLSEHGAAGGMFLYHLEDNLVSLGLITDLNYENPYLSPFDELQRLKHHPAIREYLTGGKRLAYGARAITKGGWYALPNMALPNGLLIGCAAGTLNAAKIKGTHTAMKSGLVAAETVFATLYGQGELADYARDFKRSWAGKELRRARNFAAALHKFGLWLGGAYNFIEQNILAAKLPIRLRDATPDHKTLKPAAVCPAIDYPKPDGVLSFDKTSSVYLSATNHAEDQPGHLKLRHPEQAVTHNLHQFAGPEQRFCPAGVYEFITTDGKPQLQINAQNCVHCKTCDIKDPGENIDWVAPEGGGGPNYANM